MLAHAMKNADCKGYALGPSGTLAKWTPGLNLMDEYFYTQALYLSLPNLQTNNTLPIHG